MKTESKQKEKGSMEIMEHEEMKEGRRDSKRTKPENAPVKM